MYRYIIWFELSACIFSLGALPVIWKSRYLRIYPLVLVSHFVYYVCREFELIEYGPLIAFMALFVEDGGIMVILYFAIINRSFKIFLAVAIFAQFSLDIIISFYFNRVEFLSWLSGSLSSLFVITAILWKFYEMLKNGLELNFLHTPFFYMLFVFLAYNLISWINVSIASWVSNEYAGAFDLMVHVSDFQSCFLYFTYSNAFIWMIWKEDIY
jgi:hypothetical protein